MKIPPHLPRKACDVKAHQTWRSLWWLLFLIFIAGLTSLALTLASLVWLAPSFIPDQLTATFQRVSQPQRQEIDLSVLNRTRQRLWYIYDKRQKIDGRFYSDEVDKLQAVMFSSDGWAVVYTPDYRKGMEKFWEGVDYQGSSYAIKNVFVDPVSKFNYVQFQGESFPFTSFANWDGISQGSMVWEIANNNPKQHNLEKAVSFELTKVYSIWKPYFFYNLPEAEQAGNLIIDDNGDLVGLVDENNNILFGWMINSQYASILQNGAPDYKAVAWNGYMVHGFVQQDDLTKRVAGFYVESSPTRATSSTVGVGDVITRVQNRPVEAETLSRQLLSAPEQFSVTVLRDSKEFEIIVEKTSVK